MTEQTSAELIAEAQETIEIWDYPSSYLIPRLMRALEAAEQRAEEAELERDNWKMSAEEAERAEKRWKDRAIEAERELQVAEDQANNLAGDLAQAEKERDRLDEAFDRDLPWRYDEVEAQRNQLAAVVEQARLIVDRVPDGFWVDEVYELDNILNSVTAPDDALRELKAAAWDEGNRAARLMLPTDPPRHPENPYKAREERA